MKVFINNIDENWIVDRLRKEFYEDNQDILTNNIKDADILWIIAPWTWKKFQKDFLNKKQFFAQFIILMRRSLLVMKERFL